LGGDRETEQQEQSLGLLGKHSTDCKEPSSVVSFCNWEFVGNTESEVTKTRNRHGSTFKREQWKGYTTQTLWLKEMEA